MEEFFYRCFSFVLSIPVIAHLTQPSNLGMNSQVNDRARNVLGATNDSN